MRLCCQILHRLCYSPRLPHLHNLLQSPQIQGVLVSPVVYFVPIVDTNLFDEVEGVEGRGQGQSRGRGRVRVKDRSRVGLG